MRKKVVIPFSGGADSTVLLHFAAHEEYDIDTISFDYGQRHIRELECVKLQLEIVQKKYPLLNITNKVIDVRYIKDIAPTSSLTNNDIANPNIKDMAGDAQPVTYVPFRNNMFVSIAASYAEAREANQIWYGTAQADSLAGFWDGSMEWLESMNTLISLNRKIKIKLITPLIDMSKKSIIELGVSLNVDFSKTLTCYSGNIIADATTPSSSLRLKGFLEAKFKDPIQYIQQKAIEELYISNGCVDIKY